MPNPLRRSVHYRAVKHNARINKTKVGGRRRLLTKKKKKRSLYYFVTTFLEAMLLALRKDFPQFVYSL